MNLTNVRIRKIANIVNLSCDGCSFIAQLFLCVIFWQLAEYKPPVDHDQNFPALQVEDFDEHADLMGRIWNQFMREKDPDSLDTETSSTSFLTSNTTPTNRRLTSSDGRLSQSNRQPTYSSGRQTSSSINSSNRVSNISVDHNPNFNLNASENID